MLKRAAKRMRVGVDRYLPDAFIFVIILTLIVWIVGMIVTGTGPLDMLMSWYGGFSTFLAFSMQMCAIMVLGYGLAQSSALQKLLQWATRFGTTPKTAVATLMITVFVLSWLNWGIGMIAGPILAAAFTRKMKIDYPILIAASYSAWQGGMAGLSAAAALMSASPGHAFEEILGIIPMSETVFSVFWNAVILGGIIIMTFLFVKMMPDETDMIVFVQEEAASAENRETVEKTPAYRMEHSLILKWIFVIMMGIVVFNYFYKNGANITTDIIIFALIFLGMLLHKSPIDFVQSVYAGVKGCAGIILQFPFYGGLQGMLVGSGLSAVIVTAIGSVSTPTTLPLFTFWMASIVNIFVPSAGGQWAVQGGIIGQSIVNMGLPASYAVKSFTFGDICTNLIQPFWALPALSIAGLKIKDIWGYCAIAFVGWFIWISLCNIFLIGM